MRHVLPPCCLFLALALLVAGFTIWSVDAPEEGVALHAARVSGDDALTDVLEAQLARRQFNRQVLLVCLFAGSGLMVLLAFLSLQPAKS